MEGKKFAVRNGQWLIANGERIRTLQDRWLHIGESLYSFQREEAPFLKELIDTTNRRWNTQRLKQERNNYVFNYKNPNPAATIFHANSLTAEYVQSKANQEIHSQGRNSTHNIPTCWKAPAHGVVKYNTNATWSATKNIASIAFVARDSYGLLITGHAKKVPASSPLVAEALALREAITAAYNLGWSRVVLESDCLPLIEACRKEKSLGEIHLIVLDILSVASGLIYCGFTWIRRNGNEVAHCVAKAESTNSLPLSWSSSHPHWLESILARDRASGDSSLYRPKAPYRD
ncbi:Ribonuclease H-like superfamily [Sesbania bispinosa]|nr:Ribonuclease H-like superfamily [Sesbania bispinosa]